MSSFTRLPQVGSRPHLGDIVDTDGAQEACPAPREIRSAQKNAAKALALSFAVFCVSVALFISTTPATRDADAASPASQDNAVVGLAAQAPQLGFPQALPEAAPSFGEAQADDVGFSKFRALQLLAPATLRQKPSRSGAAVRQVQKGTRVFPMSRMSGWVQVVVSEDGDGKAGFGWLPKYEGGVALLRQEAVDRTPKVRGDPPSQEEIHQRWDEIRAQNDKLKSQLSGVQASLTGHNAEHSKHEAANAVAHAAKESVNVDELKRVVTSVQSGLHKELKQSPKQILRDLSQAFEH